MANIKITNKQERINRIKTIGCKMIRDFQLNKPGAPILW